MDSLDKLLNNLVEQREIAASVTPSREMALAVTKIDEAIMWASAAKTLEQISQDAARAQAEATKGQG